MNKLKNITFLALGLLSSCVPSFAQVGGMNLSGTASTVYTDRLQTTIAGSGTTNQIFYTNAAAPFAAFGNTNLIHIRTNATSGKWEWHTDWATVVATNDSNRATGTWHAADSGAALYGYTRYTPKSVGTITTTPGDLPATDTTRVLVGPDGVIEEPANFWEANADSVADIVAQNNAASSTIATNWTGSNFTNLFGYYSQRHWNLGNFRFTPYRISEFKPIRILHVRDDAINSDNQLFEALHSFLDPNGSQAGGHFPRAIWLYNSLVSAFSGSAAVTDPIWNGGYYRFSPAGGGGITNGNYYNPTQKGTPFVDQVVFVYEATNTFSTYTIYTNSGTGPQGVVATVEGSHDRMDDVKFLMTPLMPRASGGAGRFNTLSADYVFHVYAYKDVGATRVYSQNPLILTGKGPSSFSGAENSYSIILNWPATEGAIGYRVVIYADPENSAVNNRYVDVAGTTYTVNETEYVTASPPTVTPKSAAYTGVMKPVGVTLNFPTVTNCVVTVVSSGTNIFIPGGARHTSRPMTYSLDQFGGGGGGWGIDTCFRTTSHEAVFKQLLRVCEWDLIFINDLGNPGRYLTRTRDLLTTVNLSADIVATTALITRGSPSTSEESVVELYTNAVHSGAILIDTASELRSDDPRFNAITFTNDAVFVSVDGVHSRGLTRTNVMRNAFDVLGLNYWGLGRKHGYPEPQKTFYIDLPVGLARNQSGLVTLSHLYWTSWNTYTPLGYYRTWGVYNAPSAYNFTGAWPISSEIIGAGRTNVYGQGTAITTNAVSINFIWTLPAWSVGNPSEYVGVTSGQTSFGIGAANTTNMFDTPWQKIPINTANPWRGWVIAGTDSLVPAHGFYWTHFRLRVDPNDK